MLTEIHPGDHARFMSFSLLRRYLDAPHGATQMNNRRLVGRGWRRSMLVSTPFAMALMGAISGCNPEEDGQVKVVAPLSTAAVCAGEGDCTRIQCAAETPEALSGRTGGLLVVPGVVPGFAFKVARDSRTRRVGFMARNYFEAYDVEVRVTRYKHTEVRLEPDGPHVVARARIQVPARTLAPVTLSASIDVDLPAGEYALNFVALPGPGRQFGDIVSQRAGGCESGAYPHALVARDGNRVAAQGSAPHMFIDLGPKLDPAVVVSPIDATDEPPEGATVVVIDPAMDPDEARTTLGAIIRDPNPGGVMTVGVNAGGALGFNETGIAETGIAGGGQKPWFPVQNGRIKDKLLLTYEWGAGSGTDLDTVTKRVAPGSGPEMGWSRGSGDPPFFTWSGDDTSAAGRELVTGNLKALKSANAGAANLELLLGATWYGGRGSGDMRLRIVGPAGGIRCAENIASTARGGNEPIGSLKLNLSTNELTVGAPASDAQPPRCGPIDDQQGWGLVQGGAESYVSSAYGSENVRPERFWSTAKAACALVAIGDTKVSRCFLFEEKGTLSIYTRVFRMDEKVDDPPSAVRFTEAWDPAISPDTSDGSDVRAGAKVPAGANATGVSVSSYRIASRPTTRADRGFRLFDGAVQNSTVQSPSTHHLRFDVTQPVTKSRTFVTRVRTGSGAPAPAPAPTAAPAPGGDVAFGGSIAPINELDNDFATVAELKVPTRPTFLIADNPALDLGNEYTEAECAGKYCYGAGVYFYTVTAGEMATIALAAAAVASSITPIPTLNENQKWKDGGYPGYPESLQGGSPIGRPLSSTDPLIAEDVASDLIRRFVQVGGMSELEAQRAAFIVVTAIRNLGYTKVPAGSRSITVFSANTLRRIQQRMNLMWLVSQSGNRITQDQLSFVQHHLYGRALGVPPDLAYGYYKFIAPKKARDTSIGSIKYQSQSYKRGFCLRLLLPADC